MASQTGAMYAHLQPERPPRRKAPKWPWICAALLVPTVAAAGVIWLRTIGSPESVADTYLRAWAAEDYDAMRELVAEPSLDFERTHRLFLKDLKVERASFERHVPNGVFASSAEDTVS